MHYKNYMALLTMLGLWGCVSAPTTPSRPPPLVSGHIEQQQQEVIDAVILEDENVSKEPPQTPVLARDLSREKRKEEELPAVAYLLNQAQSALDKNEFNQAAALADRALQIDRKSSRTYLILALVEAYNGRPNLVRQLAKQGLLYTSPNSSIGRQLSALVK